MVQFTDALPKNLTVWTGALIAGFEPLVQASTVECLFACFALHLGQ